jgi:hypothetical protein
MPYFALLQHPVTTGQNIFNLLLCQLFGPIVGTAWVPFSEGLQV